MTIAFEAISAGTYGTRTNTTITAPAGITDNDILLFILNVSNGSVTIATTPPAGFAAVGGSVSGILIDVDPMDEATGEGQLYAWWKRASSESGNYTATHAATQTEGAIVRYSGVKTSGDPTMNPNATSNQGYGTATHTALGATTVVNGTLVVFTEFTWDNESPLTVPGGTTPTFTARSAADPVTLYIADGVMTPAGATGNKSVTGVGTRGWGAALIFMEPSVSVGAGIFVPYARVATFPAVTSRTAHKRPGSLRKAVKAEAAGSAAWARPKNGVAGLNDSHLEVDVTAIPGVPPLFPGGGRKS